MEEEFIKYISKFDNKWCNYKKEHTFRVVELSKAIAKSINLEDKYYNTLIKASMLHDIGRFRQWQEYQTFNDNNSKYHGDIGIEVCKENNLIEKFTTDKKEQEIIFNTIKYHGTYDILDKLDDINKLIITIVRDSDKLDILHSASKELIKLSLTEDEDISKEVEEEFYNHRLINIKNIKRRTIIDKLAIWMGFIYDLNYKYSFKYIYENKIIDNIINQYIDNISDTNKEKIIKMQEEVNNYIKERL